jgi:CBS domain-containing protein
MEGLERRSQMKVKDAMMGTPYYCQLDTNLGSAAELMWIGNCGFLPVTGNDGKVVGVITDRDICVALGLARRTTMFTQRCKRWKKEGCAACR